MGNQVNLQLLTSLSFLHSCLQLDHVAGRSYLMHPESLSLASSACAQSAFQLPATTAVQESWSNPFSTPVECRGFVSLPPRAGCRSSRIVPRQALTVNYWELCVYTHTTHLSKWREGPKTRASETSSRTSYPFRNLVQLNLLSLLHLTFIEHLSPFLVGKHHNGCLPEYLKLKPYLAHKKHPDTC